MKEFLYVDDKPSLAITRLPGQKIGKSYVSYKYRIESKILITRTQIEMLRAAGFLGFGQEFLIGMIRPAPANTYQVHCKVFVNGKEVQEEPINPCGGKPYPSIDNVCYEHIVEDRVDSSG